MVVLSPAVLECYPACTMGFKEQIEGQSSRQACLLIYDQECRLCVAAKQTFETAGIGRGESDVRFLPYQSEEVQRILGVNYRAGRPDAAFLILPSGEVLQGLDAFLPLVHNFPGGKLLLWGLRFPPAKRLAEWSYRTVARHRYRWFGEAELPSPED